MRPVVREVVHEPVSVGYHRGDAGQAPPAMGSPRAPRPQRPQALAAVTKHALTSPAKAGQRFAYFGVEVAEGAFLSKTYGEGRSAQAPGLSRREAPPYD